MNSSFLMKFTYTEQVLGTLVKVILIKRPLLVLILLLPIILTVEALVTKKKMKIKKLLRHHIMLELVQPKKHLFH